MFTEGSNEIAKLVEAFELRHRITGEMETRVGFPHNRVTLLLNEAFFIRNAFYTKLELIADAVRDTTTTNIPSDFMKNTYDSLIYFESAVAKSASVSPELTMMDFDIFYGECLEQYNKCALHMSTTTPIRSILCACVLVFT